MPKKTNNSLAAALELAEDQIPYIEALGKHWGALCDTAEVASLWADRLAPRLKAAWSEEGFSFFHGTTICLSALERARRFEEILALLSLRPRTIWEYVEFGGRALVAQGKIDDAIVLAQANRFNAGPRPNEFCARVLRDAGREAEACRYEEE